MAEYLSEEPSTIPQCTLKVKGQPSKSLRSLGNPRESRYHYSPLLGSRTIRLVALHPGDDGNPIRCNLFVANLDQNPIYHGLSYAWGDPSSTVPIICSDASIDVTINLSSALRRLRHRSESVTVWADALCINQADVAERNDQVRMMGDIYRTAVHTIIYLWEEEDGLELALSLIDKLAVVARKLQKGKDQESGLAIWDQKLDINEFPLAASEDWAAFCKFFSRPWFSRCWIIKEVALSSKAPLMLCGRQSAKWDDVSEAALCCEASNL
jgi:hypothetical protein